MSSNIHAALEIGTSRTVMAIAESGDGGRLKVICHAEIPSTGVRKSQILDVQQATESIRTVLKEIERRQDASGSRVMINNTLLVVSGQHVEATPVQGTAIVNGAKISSDDIDEVSRSARSIPVPKGRELLDIVDRDYEVNDLKGVNSPKGMSGHTLKLNAFNIHADSNSIQNARNAALNVHLEIREPVFAVTCAADAVLEEYERRNGVLVIDLGGGSTGYAAYTDGLLAATGVIGVGGDHITNDIACAFQTTNAQAEQLKTEEASATLGQYTNDNARVKISGSSSLMENRTISRRALDTVVNARLKELFTILRETIEDEDLANRLHAGVVLTGGGAAQDDIARLAEQELGLPVRVGTPMNIEGLDKVQDPWTFAVISGALMYSQRNCEEKSILDGLFGRFFK